MLVEIPSSEVHRGSLLERRSSEELRRLLDRAVAAGGVFHLWGHAWEIEAASQWVELEAVLRHVGELVAAQQALCLTNGQICKSAHAGAG